MLNYKIKEIIFQGVTIFNSAIYILKYLSHTI